MSNTYDPCGTVMTRLIVGDYMARLGLPHPVDGEGHTFTRRATLDDVPDIHAMFAEFVASTQYRRFLGDDPSTAQDTIARLIAFESDAAIFVVQAPDGLVGMFGLSVFAHPFSGERVAQEAFWWLNPDRRGYGAFLLRRAERWAREHGAVRLMMMAPIDKPRVGEIYTALGYSAVEITYSKELQP